MDLQVSVVIDETQLAEFVHEERERGVPIISARVVWLIFAKTGSGLPSFPKFAISRSSLANRFSLELNS